MAPKLESYRQTLRKQENELQTLDSEIFDLLPEEAIEKEVKETLDFEGTINETLCIIDAILGKEEKRNATEDETLNSSSESRNTFKRQAKLAKLQLPHFDGKVEDWASFWDIFEAAVHADPDLSEVTKFQYLQSLLKGEAKNAIAGYKVTNANYGSVVEVLKERFGKTQAVVSTHVAALVALPSVDSCNDLKRLRALCDKTESIIRSLEGLDIHKESYDIFLTPVLMEKLPNELKIIAGRKLGVEKWDLNGLMEIFKTELSVRENCGLIPSDKKKSMKGYAQGEKREQTASTTSALHAGDRHITGFCAFCKGKHASSRCQTVTNAGARRRILMDAGKRFSCFRNGHIAAGCSSNVKCFSCGGRHHVAVCSAKAVTSGRRNEADNHGVKAEGLKEDSAQAQPSSASNASVNVEQGIDQKILLQTAKAKVSSPGNPLDSANVRILLDSGAQRSYVSYRLCDKLSLPKIGSEKVLIKTFGNDEPCLTSCDIVQLRIACPDGLNLFIKAYTIPIVCSPLSDQSIGLAKKSYPHLRNLPLADFATGQEDLSVDILLGSDHYWSVVLGHTVRGERGPTALLTRFGYVLSGPVDVVCQRTNVNQVSSSHVMKVSHAPCEDEVLRSDLKRFWDYETLGIKQDEPSVYDKFTEEITTKDDRYEVSLPFKENHEIIPDNFSVSEQRLGSLLKKLKNQPEVLQEYDNIISDQLDKGIIEKVDIKQDIGIGKVHYLPHRAVIREDKSTTRVRIVYDASSKLPGEVSLNDCLYAGPPLTPLIFDILLRFRSKGIALIGDIEKAFLNIGIKPEERDYLRFLWVDDIHNDNPKVVCYRFSRLVFGLVSSPFVLNATIRAHLAKYISDEQFVRNALNSLYVDDYVSTFESQEEAFESYKKLKSCFKEGGFNMRKWESNSPDLVQDIAKEESLVANLQTESTESKTQEENESFSKFSIKNDCAKNENDVKVLGLAWDKTSDTVRIDFIKAFSKIGNDIVTKRDILSSTAQLYDPLGLLSPIVVPLKLIFQDLCKQKVDWDSPLPQETLSKWEKIASDVKLTGPISVSRSVNDMKSDEIESIELHGFGDASNVAFGAVVYIRSVKKSGEVSINLIASKTRLAPLKSDTIPRLELMAALLLARLMTSVREALQSTIKIDKVVCWLDSQIVLWWIFGVEKEFRTFTQNRVLEIRKLVNPRFWNYCPTNQNPADIASRGCKASELISSEMWWFGPTFLRESQEHWPNILNLESKLKPSEDVAAQVDKEIRSNPRKDFTDVFIGASSVSNTSIENVISCEDFGDANRLFRVTAYVLRFISNLTRKLSKQDVVTSDLTAEEINNAQNLWFHEMQSLLKTERNYQKHSVELRVFEDENHILRCRGRIENAFVPFGTKFPILLPRSHHITKLLIFRAHSNVKHNGTSETLSDLRSSFWIVRGRQLVRSLISKCFICKRLEGRAYNLPPAAPLPDFRVIEDYAFANIGVDFAGPVYVKDVYSSDKSMHKAYIAIFTCTVSRALHLELCPDQSAPSFIKCFKRFQGRRGIPKLVVSDNGKTFRDKSVQRQAAARHITWKFNVPRASFWGGFFEVMVRLVKRCLKKIVGNACLTLEELETILIEIESVVNSRPLTFVNSDFDEEPITPSSLVIGRRLLTLPRIEHDLEIDDSKISLTQRQLYLKTLLKHFWSRWSREYLLNLREFHKNKAKSPLRVIKNGDVVVILNDKIKRQNWKLGKIVNVYRGSDQIIRAADVKTVDQSGKPIVLKRSIVHLFPLEVNEESNEVQKEQDNSAKSEDPTDILIQQVRDEDVVEHIEDQL